MPPAALRGPFWRVFLWDAAAPPGAPYTPEFILPASVQTGGRFDLGTSPTLYPCSTPAAVRYGTPDPLHLAHPVVLAAARELKMAVAKR